MDRLPRQLEINFGSSQVTLQGLKYTTGAGGGKQVGPFGGSEGVRYVYTEKRGWIDLAHFFQVVAEAENNIGNGWEKGIARTVGRGYANNKLWEKTQEVENAQTCETQWSYEDGPSNQAGLDFFLDYYSEGGDLMEAMNNFFIDAGATSPENAPNYIYIQATPQKERRFEQNKSLKPILNPKRVGDEDQ